MTTDEMILGYVQIACTASMYLLGFELRKMRGKERERMVELYKEILDTYDKLSGEETIAEGEHVCE